MVQSTRKELKILIGNHFFLSYEITSRRNVSAFFKCRDDDTYPRCGVAGEGHMEHNKMVFEELPDEKQEL